MTTIALHEPPRLRTAGGEQIRAVGVSIRNEAVLFVGLMLAFLALGVFQAVRIRANPNQHITIGYAPSGAAPMWIIACLFPFAVWRGEDPAHRAYHWAMPVPRAWHAVLKLTSGWLWLVLGVAAYMLFIAALNRSTGAITGYWSPFDVPAWQWLVPFTACSVLYALSSAVVVGSRHPGRWLLGVLAIWLFGAMFVDAWDMHALFRIVSTVWSGRFGVTAVLLGRGGHLHGDAMRVAWAVATVAWGAGAMIALAWAVWWRREA